MAERDVDNTILKGLRAKPRTPTLAPEADDLDSLIQRRLRGEPPTQVTPLPAPQVPAPAAPPVETPPRITMPTIAPRRTAPLPELELPSRTVIMPSEAFDADAAILGQLGLPREDGAMRRMAARAAAAVGAAKKSFRESIPKVREALGAAPAALERVADIGLPTQFIEKITERAAGEAATQAIRLTPDVIRAIGDLPVQRGLGGAALADGGRLAEPRNVRDLAQIAFGTIPDVEHLKERLRGSIQLKPEDIPPGKFNEFLAAVQVTGGVAARGALLLLPESPAGIAFDLSFITGGVALRLLGRGLVRGRARSALQASLRDSFQATASGKMAENELLKIQDELVNEAQSVLRALAREQRRRGGRALRGRGLRKLKQARKARRVLSQSIVDALDRGASLQPKMPTREVSEAMDQSLDIYNAFVVELAQVVPPEGGAVGRALKKALPGAYRRKALVPSKDETIAEFSRRVARSRMTDPDKIGEFAKSGLETRGILQRMGPEGVELARRYDSWGDETIKLAAQVMADARPIIERLNDQEKLVVARLLDPLRHTAILPRERTERVVRATEELVKAFKPLFDRAERAKGTEFLDEVGTFSLDRNRFFGHYYNFNDKGVVEEAVKRLESSDAVKFRMAELSERGANLDEIDKMRPDAAMKQFMGFQKQVLNETTENYEQTWKLAQMIGTKEPIFVKDLEFSLDRVAQSLAKRVTRVEQLGSNDNITDNLIASLKTAGRDPKFLDDVNTLMIRGQIPNVEAPLLAGMRAYNVYTKMGFSALRNSGQYWVNTTSRVGLVNAVKAHKAYKQSVGADAYARYFREVVMQGMRRDISEATGVPISSLVENKIFGWTFSPQNFLHFVQFMRTEKANRVRSGLSGAYYAREQVLMLKLKPKNSTAFKDAVRRLKELGFGDERIAQLARKTAKMTKDEQLTAGLRVIADTQFKTGPLDLPLYWSSPTGKFFTQFSPFLFRQAIFTKNLVRSGDRGSVAMFMALSVSVGIPIQTVYDFLSGKPVQDLAVVRSYDRFRGNRRATATDNILTDLLRYMGASVGIGIWAEIMTDLAPELVGRERFPGRGKRIAGPGVSTLIEAFDAASNLTGSDAERKNSMRFVLRQVPLIGRPLSNMLIKRKLGTGERRQDAAMVALAKFIFTTEFEAISSREAIAGTGIESRLMAVSREFRESAEDDKQTPPTSIREREAADDKRRVLDQRERLRQAFERRTLRGFGGRK